MQREKAAAAGEKKSKPESPKSGRTRLIATVLTWLLLNLIWLQASQAVAVNEVAEHGGRINRHYVLDVPDMMGIGREIPVELECDYGKRNASAAVVHVELSHERPDGETVLLHDDLSDADCEDRLLMLSPGTHHFRTRVVLEDGQADVDPDANLSAEMDLGMRLWEPFRTEGFIAANVLGLLLGIADRVIREIIRRRRESLVRNMPLHTRRQQEEWEQIVHSVSGGDAVDVQDLVMGPTGSADESMEMQRRRMREQFSAQSSEADGDTTPFEDEAAVDADDELGEGTTEGLTGKVRKDDSIRTVKDLWKQMGGEDDDKRRKR